MSLIPLGILAAAGGAKAGSYESIASATGTGSSGTITFSSIPSTYSHLQIRINAKGGSGAIIFAEINSDTGANYSRHFLRGNGTDAFASGAASQTKLDYVGYASDTADICATSIIDIIDYASTTKYKTSRSFFGLDRNGSGFVYLSSGSWQSTSAITSISLKIASGSFDTISTFALYGIKGA